MAEVFGVVAGAVGIASALSACIDGIGGIQIGRHFGSDFETFQLRLRMLELRLARWGEATRVYEDPQLNSPFATADESRAAKDTLFRILELIQKSHSLSQKFQPPRGQKGDCPTGSTGQLKGDIVSLDGRIRDIITQRKHGKVGGVKIARWVLYSREHAMQLIADITSLIDLLQQLFPMPEKELALAREEVRQLSSAVADQQSTMRNLQQAVEGIDGDFKKAIESLAARGHRYEDQLAEDDARIHNGNTFTKAWEEASAPLPTGPAMTFGYIRAGGSSRVRNGDVYVDRDDFWS
ncbi:hypothetical protein F5Y04DRAFT_171205 [Hypomontagnella monticulosa]|nr:hypothetical protein F5Y04DRAFT_171205 [Hypomontagnella monticulosa]